MDSIHPGHAEMRIILIICLLWGMVRGTVDPSAKYANVQCKDDFVTVCAPGGPVDCPGGFMAQTNVAACGFSTLDHYLNSSNIAGTCCYQTAAAAGQTKLIFAPEPEVSAPAPKAAPADAAPEDRAVVLAGPSGNLAVNLQAISGYPIYSNYPSGYGAGGSSYGGGGGGGYGGGGQNYGGGGGGYGGASYSYYTTTEPPTTIRTITSQVIAIPVYAQMPPYVNYSTTVYNFSDFNVTYPIYPKYPRYPPYKLPPGPYAPRPFAGSYPAFDNGLGPRPYIPSATKPYDAGYKPPGGGYGAPYPPPANPYNAGPQYPPGNPYNVGPQYPPANPYNPGPPVPSGYGARPPAAPYNAGPPVPPGDPYQPGPYQPPPYGAGLSSYDTGKGWAPRDPLPSASSVAAAVEDSAIATDRDEADLVSTLTANFLKPEPSNTPAQPPPSQPPPSQPPAQSQSDDDAPYEDTAQPSARITNYYPAPLLDRVPFGSGTPLVNGLQALLAQLKAAPGAVQSVIDTVQNALSQAVSSSNPSPMLIQALYYAITAVKSLPNPSRTIIQTVDALQIILNRIARSNAPPPPIPTTSRPVPPPPNTLDKVPVIELNTLASQFLIYLKALQGTDVAAPVLISLGGFIGNFQLAPMLTPSHVITLTPLLNAIAYTPSLRIELQRSTENLQKALAGYTTFSTVRHVGVLIKALYQLSAVNPNLDYKLLQSLENVVSQTARLPMIPRNSPLADAVQEVTRQIVQAFGTPLIHIILAKVIRCRTAPDTCAFVTPLPSPPIIFRPPPLPPPVRPLPVYRPPVPPPVPEPAYTPPAQAPPPSDPSKIPLVVQPVYADIVNGYDQNNDDYGNKPPSSQPNLDYKSTLQISPSPTGPTPYGTNYGSYEQSYGQPPPQKPPAQPYYGAAGYPQRPGYPDARFQYPPRSQYPQSPAPSPWVQPKSNPYYDPRRFQRVPGHASVFSLMGPNRPDSSRPDPNYQSYQSAPVGSVAGSPESYDAPYNSQENEVKDTGGDNADDYSSQQNGNDQFRDRSVRVSSTTTQKPNRPTLPVQYYPSYPVGSGSDGMNPSAVTASPPVTPASTTPPSSLDTDNPESKYLVPNSQGYSAPFNRPYYIPNLNNGYDSGYGYTAPVQKPYGGPYENPYSRPDYNGPLNKYKGAAPSPDYTEYSYASYTQPPSAYDNYNYATTTPSYNSKYPSDPYKDQNSNGGNDYYGPLSVYTRPGSGASGDSYTDNKGGSMLYVRYPQRPSQMGQTSDGSLPIYVRPVYASAHGEGNDTDSNDGYGQAGARPYGTGYGQNNSYAPSSAYSGTAPSPNYNGRPVNLQPAAPVNSQSTYGNSANSQPVYGAQGNSQPGYGSPVTSQSGYGTPVGSQSSYGTPVNSQTSYGRPVNGQPSYGAPIGSQPSYGSPANSQAAYGAPVGSQPSYGAPVNSQTSYGAPVNSQPSYGAPVNGQPSYGAAVNSQPSYGAPVNSQPSYGAPVNGQPTYGGPVNSQPAYGAPTNAQPVGSVPTNAQSTYGVPVNSQPTYGAPVNSQPSYATSVNTQPAYGSPVNTQSVGGLPVNTQQVAANSVNTQPVATVPANSQTIAGNPVYTQPVGTYPVNSQSVATAPVYSQPVGTAPVNAQAVSTAPVNTQSANAQSIAGAPVYTQPVSSVPINTQSVSAVPVNTQPAASAPVDAQSVATAPVYTQSISAVPANTQPVNTQFVSSVPVNTQSVAVSSVNTQPVATQPVNTQPVGTYPVNTQPVATQPVNTQSVGAVPVNTQAVATLPVNTQPVGVSPVNTRPVAAKPVGARPVYARPVQAIPVFAQSVYGPSPLYGPNFGQYPQFPPNAQTTPVRAQPVFTQPVSVLPVYAQSVYGPSSLYGPNVTEPPQESVVEEEVNADPVNVAPVKANAVYSQSVYGPSSLYGSHASPSYQSGAQFPVRAQYVHAAPVGGQSVYSQYAPSSGYSQQFNQYGQLVSQYPINLQPVNAAQVNGQSIYSQSTNGQPSEETEEESASEINTQPASTAPVYAQSIKVQPVRASPVNYLSVGAASVKATPVYDQSNPVYINNSYPTYSTNPYASGNYGQSSSMYSYSNSPYGTYSSGYGTPNLPYSVNKGYNFVKPSTITQNPASTTTAPYKSLKPKAVNIGSPLFIPPNPNAIKVSPSLAAMILANAPWKNQTRTAVPQSKILLKGQPTTTTIPATTDGSDDSAAGVSLSAPSKVLPEVFQEYFTTTSSATRYGQTKGQITAPNAAVKYDRGLSQTSDMESCGIPRVLQEGDLRQLITSGLGAKSRQRKANGTRSKREDKERISRITTSIPAQEKEICWMAAVLMDNAYKAGGSIVSPSYILTAAHVVDGRDIGKLKVRVGDVDVRQSSIADRCGQTLSVDLVIIHPDFNRNTLAYDIALLRLRTPIDFASPCVCRICLSDIGPDEGDTCIVSGFGSTRLVDPFKARSEQDAFASAGPNAEILRYAGVPVVSNEDCSSAMKDSRLLPDAQPSFVSLDTSSQLCAGGVSKTDACYGDGGSPLVCYDGEKFYQAGVVSFGRGCGKGLIPAIYGKTTDSIKNWIVSQASYLQSPTPRTAIKPH